MIEIKKGSVVLKVSNGAYQDVFKKQGYTIVSSNKKDTLEVAKATSDVEKFKEEEKRENKEKTKEDKTIVSSKELNKKIELNVDNNIIKNSKKGK